MCPDHQQWCEEIAALAREAGKVILDVYATDFAVDNKADASPVTLADERAEAVILAGLARIAPGIPAISEEAASAGRIPDVNDRFWLVDPLDGTKEFIGRNGEFTVNIALVEHGEPVLGVVFAPALDRLFAGVVGAGAYVEEKGLRSAIACRRAPLEGCTVVSSRSHGSEAPLADFLAGRRVARSVFAGSSLKLCLIAACEADIYPRFGRTMEWDIAAGHAVVRAAGGHVRTLEGSELRYAKPGLDNPHFVASGLD
ncbi:MAG TPA: 3'(2'),5'-bisphosphate nucleotidase CysQ [Paraburkholderia sp.]|uniref:3'(2'),5'-bisphosphate nucleotidase CysQ n=1 Tax=Paraburkholderia sp. TaxID=1926495 RepID=UPI002B49E3BB|nr:3'(2'),5'-bisphosphate nucleotidase CysQ [Paraburkholderia sp.]HKR46332.1 3'(2'),5'-bisphosphate nucleotidase CysQ [Paraburkholderia sp.]